MVDVRIENVYKYYGSMGDVAAVHDLTMDINCLLYTSPSPRDTA